MLDYQEEDDDSRIVDSREDGERVCSSERLVERGLRTCVKGAVDMDTGDVRSLVSLFLLRRVRMALMRTLQLV
jgi:hypothetical protein